MARHSKDVDVDVAAHPPGLECLGGFGVTSIEHGSPTPSLSALFKAGIHDKTQRFYEKIRSEYLRFFRKKKPHTARNV